MTNCPECPDLITALMYDTKLVHIMSTTAQHIYWIEKKRRIWCGLHKQVMDMVFLWLNLIDDYNNKMNSMDIVDQLRNQYRPDHWMRNRRWWWAFSIWTIGVATVNARKIYSDMWHMLKKKHTPGLPPKWSHRVFMEEMVYDFLSPKVANKHVANLKAMDDDTFDATMKTARAFSVFSFSSRTQLDPDEEWDFACDSGIDYYNKKVKVSVMTKNRLDSGYFAPRLDGQRHPTIIAGANSICQYCHYSYSNILDTREKEVYRERRQNRKKHPKMLDLQCHSLSKL